jgi:hypothetical protein
MGAISQKNKQPTNQLQMLYLLMNDKHDPKGECAIHVKVIVKLEHALRKKTVLKLMMELVLLLWFCHTIALQ